MLLCYPIVWLLCIFPRSSLLKTVVVHPSNKKEWLIVLETISTSSTMMVASLAVISRFPLILSARHFLIPCHPFTVKINCYVPDKLIVTFRTRFWSRPLSSTYSCGTSTITHEGLPPCSCTHWSQDFRRQATGKSRWLGRPHARLRSDASSSACICRQPSINCF